MLGILCTLLVRCLLYFFFPLIMCLHVEPATEEVVFEAIAEPQEQLELAQPEVSENPAQGPVDRSTD